MPEGEHAADLSDLERKWDEGARRDPMYVVLSVPEMKGGLWESERFFETGRAEIAEVMQHASRLGYPRQRRRALDFGCGIGRLTQALSDYFEIVDGVDISGAMIEEANRRNRHGAKCRYHHNLASDLGLFEGESFDFVYSNIVLQHMEPRLSAIYVGEFTRVLAPEGLLMFQLPSEPAVQPSTGAVAPLPPSAFQAEILLDPVKIRADPGSSVEIRVFVTNRSHHMWPAERDSSDVSRQINIGNHWLRTDGTMLAFDDRRVALPKDVASAETVAVALHVTLPSVAGEYVLEVDVVQENVGWFADHGSTAARCEVTIEGSQTRGNDQRPEIWQPDCLEMFAVRRSNVVELLRDSGLRVLEVTKDNWAGPEWVGFRYVATKA